MPPQPSRIPRPGQSGELSGRAIGRRGSVWTIAAQMAELCQSKRRELSMTKPNVLLIMPDQMRGDCLSLERHPVLLTPNIDHIGAAGTHFTRAYTTCPSCIPARRSLLTGQYPSSSGMVGFAGGYPIRERTLPQELHAAGYHTAIAGRYMHQDPYEEPYGYETRILGSTYIGGDEYNRTVAAQAPGSGNVQGHGIQFNGWQARPWQLPDYLHPTNWVAETSRRILREHTDDRPLFLTASFYAPHPPFIPPAFYMDRYLRQDLPELAIGDWAERPANDGIGLPVDSPHCVLEGERKRSAQAGYYGLINHIDDQISWLVREFISRSRAMQRDWVILFTADHGELLGDHYYFRKCEPYEGSSRIPFLIQGAPGLGFQTGRTCDRPVCLEDIMPTLLELAGIEIPDTVDGISLVPALRGEDTVIREQLHTEHAPCYSVPQGFQMLTDGRWKYIWRPHDGSEQLFDLNNDPAECRDLAGSAGHRQELTSWRRRLVAQLKDRPEGFSDGVNLIPADYPAVMPHLREQQ